MIIKKILAYDLYSNNKEYGSRYERVVRVLDQTCDPDSTEPEVLECRGLDIYTSPRCRALQCLNQSTAKSIAVCSALNEIPFSLTRYCTEDEFNREGSTAVRRSFVKAFISNTLNISHTQIEEEIKYILSLKNRPQTPLCISHTFRMKLIEVYAVVGDRLFKDPQLLQRYVDYRKHLYPFGTTIEV